MTACQRSFKVDGRIGCEKNSGEKEGACACSYIRSGGKTRRHGKKEEGREGAKRDDEVTVPVLGGGGTGFEK
jgi:hypothetical protein